MRWDGREWRWLGTLLGILGVAQWFLMSHRFALFHDPLVYLAGAESLATAGDYRFATHEGRPPIGLYPPLHSAWLALGWKLWPQFPENLLLLRAMLLVPSLGALGTAYGLMRCLEAPRWLATGLVLNLGLGPNWNEWLSWMMSDAAMIGWLLGAALVGLKRGGRHPGWNALAGGMLAMAVGWRTAAAGAIFGLGVGWALGALRAGRFREEWVRIGVWTVPAAMVAVGWSWMSRAGVSYGDAYRVVLGNAGGGWTGYGKLFGQQVWELFSGRPFLDGWMVPVSRAGFVVLRDWGWPGSLLIWGVSLLVWLGLAMAVRAVWRAGSGRERVLWAAAMGYLLLVFVAPNGGPFMGRYFLPLLPFWVAFAWRGWRDWIQEWKGPWLKRSVWIGVTVLLLVLPFNLRLALSAKRHWNQVHDLADLKPFAEAVDRRLGPDAVIAADWSLPLMHFRAWSGRRVVADRFYIARSFSAMPESKLRPTHVLVATVGWDQYKPGAGFDLELESGAGKYQLFRVGEAEGR